MSDLTDKLDAVKQAVTELENQVNGASPLQAVLATQQDQLTSYARALQAETLQNENRTKELDDREAKLAERETKLEAAKAALKASK